MSERHAGPAAGRRGLDGPLEPGAADPERAETALQRADRNWDELLSELRVTQTGVAILFSLLLTVPFSSRFDAVTPFQRGVYLVALLSSAVSAVLLIAPVAYHRVLFARRQKQHLVRTGDRLALAGLAVLSVALTAVLLLVTDVLLPTPVAFAISGGFGVGTAALWFVPAGLRRRLPPPEPAPPPEPEPLPPSPSEPRSRP